VALIGQSVIRNSKRAGLGIIRPWLWWPNLASAASPRFQPRGLLRWPVRRTRISMNALCGRAGGTQCRFPDHS